MKKKGSGINRKKNQRYGRLRKTERSGLEKDNEENQKKKQQQGGVREV
jgi:hypothetical protein